jgi:hypothetical protein
MQVRAEIYYSLALRALNVDFIAPLLSFAAEQVDIFSPYKVTENSF